MIRCDSKDIYIVNYMYLLNDNKKYFLNKWAY